MQPHVVQIEIERDHAARQRLSQPRRSQALGDRLAIRRVRGRDAVDPPGRQDPGSAEVPVAHGRVEAPAGAGVLGEHDQRIRLVRLIEPEPERLGKIVDGRGERIRLHTEPRCQPRQLREIGLEETRGVALSDDEIRERMSGNICRCGAYVNIVAAAREAKGA